MMPTWDELLRKEIKSPEERALIAAILILSVNGKFMSMQLDEVYGIVCDYAKNGAIHDSADMET